MPRTWPIQTAGTAGQWSGLLKNRPDLEGYFYASQLNRNVVCLPQGGWSRCGGTEFCGTTKDASSSTKKVKPIGFIYSTTRENSYCLEFGDQYIRFFWAGDRGQIIETAPSHPLMTQVGGSLDDVSITGTYTGTSPVIFKIVVSQAGTPDTVEFFANGVSEGTAQLDGSPVELPLNAASTGIYFDFAATTGHGAGDYWEFYVGYPYEIGSPYSGTEVPDITFRQKGDVLYLYHEDHPLRKLIRNDHDDWELKVVDTIEAGWLGRSAAVRYRIFDTEPSPGVYVQPAQANSSSALDNKFDEGAGAVLLGQGIHTGTIAFSSMAGYYNSIPSYLSSVCPTLQQFAWEISGDIQITEAGSYSFALNAGFGGDLFVDDALVVDWTGNHNMFSPNDANAQTNYAAHSGSKTLSEGTHTFKIRCYNTNSTKIYGFALAWKKPGDSTYAVIPASQFVEQSDSSEVEIATFEVLDIDTGEIADVPTNAAEMDASCTSETTGVTLNHAGKYDDRIHFHSQSGAAVLGFDADRPPVAMPDGSRFALVITGWLYAPEAGSYNFALDSNDAADFVLHEGDVDTPTAEIGWYGEHGCATSEDEFTQAGWDQHPSGAATLANQWYQFRIRLVNGGWGFGLSLAWKTPSVPDTWVPVPRIRMTAMENGYPRCGYGMDGRHWVGGMRNRPDTVMASQSQDEENFEQGTDGDQGIELQIDSNKADLIQALLGYDQELFVFTDAGIHRIGSDDGGSIRPPDHFKRRPSIETGAAFVQPVKADISAFFVGLSRKVLYELLFDERSSSYEPDDITERSSDMFGSGIKNIVIQKKGTPEENGVPITILWVVTDAGELYGMSYSRKNRVYAWFEREFDGGTAEDFCVVPGANGEELWLAVDWGTYRTFEVINPNLGTDSAVTLSDTDTATAAHLAGEEVEIRYGTSSDAITGYETATLDVDGVATLDDSHAYVEVGIPITATIRTMPLEVVFSQNSTSLGTVKRWMWAALQLLNAGGTITLGKENGTKYTILDAETTVFSGRKQTTLLGRDREAVLEINLSGPMPATVLAIHGEVEI